MTAAATPHTATDTARMNAVRVHEFGGLEAVIYEEIPRPAPGAGQVLVRVGAAGVGPWDALIRSGQSALAQPLPLILGSELAGVVAEVGADVTDFRPGDNVFGATNPLFIGAYAEYALAEATLIAPQPKRLGCVEAASVPIAASTAWQMVFEHGQVDATKRVLVQGAGGNVGAYAVQLAVRAGAEVIATAYPRDVDYVRSLGADRVVDVQTAGSEEPVKDVDVVLDLVGGDTLDRAFDALKPGGIVVSAVALPNQEKAAARHVRGLFFYVAVTTAGLTKIANLLDTGQIVTRVGKVLPLAQARLAHEMLAGRPHKPGKIVLSVPK